MVALLADMDEVGMDIDDLRKTNILVQAFNNNQTYKLKLFYDERQRGQRKSVYGLYLSPERLQEEDRQIEKLYQNSVKLVFELALLVLDVMSEQLKESYYSGTKLNLKTVQKKLNLVCSKYPNSYMANIITQMLQPIEQRPSLVQLKAQNLAQLGNKLTFSVLKTGNDTVVEVSESGASDRQFQVTNSLKTVQPSKQVAAGINNSITASGIKVDAGSLMRQSHRSSILSQPTLSNIAHPQVIESLNRIKQRLSLLKTETRQYQDGSTYVGQMQNNVRQGIGIYSYSHGDIYFGEWRQNSLVSGTYIFKNKQSYQGQVKNGKHGFGIYRYANGNVYEGYWQNDLKQGKGEMRYPNGDKYDGMWVKGKKNGYGIYRYANGMVYQGNYSDGKKSGFGTVIFPDSTKFEGNWENSSAEGFGKLLYQNGDSFQGQFRQSIKHGAGVYRWSDATQFSGNFANDTLSGRCRVEYSNGDIYEGSLVDGVKQGQGTYIYANKDIFAGSWRGDCKHVGKYTFNDGSSFQGEFRNNEIFYGMMVYPSGDYYQGEFRNNERHGYGKYIFSDGTTCSGEWKYDNFIR